MPSTARDAPSFAGPQLRAESPAAAADNLASLRVLQKCGFTISAHSRFHANARGAEIDEVLLTFKPPETPNRPTG